jgi:2-dehydropantoate 2-reductase
MDIAVIGTGGIGGYYGARLAHGGHRVHFLLHTEYEHVRAHGLVVDSHLGDFSLDHPLVYAQIDEMPPCDLVCIAVKATANETVFPQIAPLLKEGTEILLLQNGFGYEQVLQALYPDRRIFGGMCFICSFRDGPGVIRHTAYGKVSLAALDKADAESGRLHAIEQVFRGAGVETEVLPDLALARWRKLVWNIPYNGLCVIRDCKTDTLAHDPSMRDAVRAIMEEILEAAGACGNPVEASFVDEMMLSTDRMPPYEPSMRLDFLAHRPLEIRAIYGNAIDAAAAHGYDMKYAKMMKWQLETIEREQIIGGKYEQT